MSNSSQSWEVGKQSNIAYWWAMPRHFLMQLKTNTPNREKHDFYWSFLQFFCQCLSKPLLSSVFLFHPWDETLMGGVCVCGGGSRGLLMFHNGGAVQIRTGDERSVWVNGVMRETRKTSVTSLLWDDRQPNKDGRVSPSGHSRMKAGVWQSSTNTSCTFLMRNPSL